MGLIPVLTAEVLYALACTLYGTRPDAPLWLRWPTIAWNRMMYGRPVPKPLPRPDHAKIERLERELGLVDTEPEQPTRHGRTVCLTKNCPGETTEIHTWSGTLTMRIHECETP